MALACKVGPVLMCESSICKSNDAIIIINEGRKISRKGNARGNRRVSEGQMAGYGRPGGTGFKGIVW